MKPTKNAVVHSVLRVDLGEVGIEPTAKGLRGPCSTAELLARALAS